jgi:hypothetical protein
LTNTIITIEKIRYLTIIDNSRFNVLIHTCIINYIVHFTIKEKKKLFATFVDFEKAFDTVWRDALWSKLLINTMNKIEMNETNNIDTGNET